MSIKKAIALTSYLLGVTNDLNKVNRFIKRKRRMSNGGKQKAKNPQ